MATLPTSSTGYEAGCFCSFSNSEEPALRRKTSRRKEEVSPQVDDAALAREMNELSVKERERMFEEIHGVAEEKEESPEFIASCMEKMDQCLSKIPQAKRRDLDRALFLKPSIRKDGKFKLMFLRSEYYDAKKAAARMARYFTFKRNLFGEGKLASKITLDDLDEKDIEIAKRGGVTLALPKPDRSGRPIMFVDMTRSTFHEGDTVNRFAFHQVMSILRESETAQKKGIVLLLICAGGEFISGRPPTPSEAIFNMKETQLTNMCLPVRLSSCHYCHDNPLTKFLTGLVKAGMGKEIRLRLRTHFGSPTEIRYSLGSFGIDTNGIILADGEEDMKPKLLQEYFDNLRSREKQEEEAIIAERMSTKIAAFPNPHDVLLGRGRPSQEFPGNQSFMRLIDSEVERYKACAHLFEKTLVLVDVMKKIRSAGGQFLKRGEDNWVIVDEQMAMEKIRKALQARPATVAAKADRVVSDRSTKRLKVDPSVGVENS